jgi:hypothetical protein
MIAENNEEKKEKRKESGKVEVLRLTLSYFWDDVGEDLLKAVGLLFLIAGCAAAVWFAASYKFVAKTHRLAYGMKATFL